MEQSRLRIDSALESDKPALRTLYREVKSVAFSGFLRQEPSAIAFDRDIESETILVAWYDGKIVGFISVWEQDFFIHHLYVDPAFHRMGIGSALINRVLRGKRAVFKLKCLEANHSAVAFYLRTGWVERSRGHSDDGPYVLFEKAGF